MADSSGLVTVGLFAGIGGLEEGLQRAGHKTRVLCEIDSAAQIVLKSRFPGVPLIADVREASIEPKDELIVAGFPCTDLSQAGRTAGIEGRYSGLVGQVFRMLDEGADPAWVLLENVPFMLVLGGGSGVRYLTEQFASRGYRWAYRVLDTRAFGIPQRRRRVYFLASRHLDPAPRLLSGSIDPVEYTTGAAYGFYWTEGVRGLGWAVDAVPTLKGGSTIGIPSPPAIWLGDGRVVTPDIRDAERLQGFPADWTRPAVDQGCRIGTRWRMVGNAVTVDVAEWVGRQLVGPAPRQRPRGEEFSPASKWPEAAWGSGDRAFRSDVSSWPVSRPFVPIDRFLRYPPKPLSARATAGFLKRLGQSSLRYRPEFWEALEKHHAAMVADAARTETCPKADVFPV